MFIECLFDTGPCFKCFLWCCMLNLHVDLIGVCYYYHRYVDGASAAPQVRTWLTSSRDGIWTTGEDLLLTSLPHEGQGLGPSYTAVPDDWGQWEGRRGILVPCLGTPRWPNPGLFQSLREILQDLEVVLFPCSCEEFLGLIQSVEP